MLKLFVSQATLVLQRIGSRNVENSFISSRFLRNLEIFQQQAYNFTKFSCSPILPKSKMHQSKISNFFKKSSTSSPTSSPVKKTPAKKASDDEVAEEKPKKSSKVIEKKVLKETKKEEVKNGRKKKSKVTSSEDDEVVEEKPKRSSKVVEKNVLKETKKEEEVKSGRKRKSKASSEEDEEEVAPRSKENGSSAKRKASESNGNKKPRRRIVIQDDSSDEGEAVEEKMEVEEEETEKKVLKLDSDDEEEIVEEVKVKAKKSESPKETKSTKKPKAQEKKKPEKPKKSSPKTSPKTKTVKKEDSDEGDDDDKKSKVKEEKKDVKKEDEKKEVKPLPMNTLGGGASAKGWNSDYNPAKSHYHPIDDASWKRGDKVPYLALSKTLEVIEATSSRLKCVETLANYFRSVIVLTPEDLLYSVYLCLNKLAPAYEGIELGVAETNIMKAIAQATGRGLDRIKSEAGTLGDLGLVAENSRSNQKTLFQPQPLSVSGVFHKLKEIANMHGNAAQSKKISMITSMLVACKYSEARYLTRSLAGKLRIGLAEQSLLMALAQATYLTPPDQDLSEWPPKIINAGKKMSADSLKANIEKHAFIVKSCFCDCPNYDILIKALLEVGIDGVEERCKLTPGIPPRPMLAQPTKGVADVLERFEGIRFTCEYKYDGERAQIHLSDDGKLNIYSRNQENNTSKYPDIISRFSSCIKGDVKSCILDSEAVAWDIENKSILPFQVLSTRKRKDANEAEIKVQVCIFAFDLIYLNGVSLIKEPLIKRRELLHKHFQEVTGEFVFATSLDTDSMEEVQEFLEESIKGNCEGLMVKTLDERATYELAKRSQKWLKLKKDYLDSGGDSLDLVVIGGFYGKGKRAGAYGGFLLACYDPDEEVYQTICKLGTGFTDEQLQSHSEFLKPHVIPSPKSYYRFNSQLTPDQWFDAVQVWEVKCADLSLSPVHTAAEGIADPQRGVSLRFPRFLRIRDDKNIEDATSAQQVSSMYKNQEQVKNTTGNKGKADDEDEFY